MALSKPNIQSASNVIYLADFIATGVYDASVAGLKMTLLAIGVQSTTTARLNFLVFKEACLTAVGGTYTNNKGGTVNCDGDGVNVWTLERPSGVTGWTLPSQLTLVASSITRGAFECWDMSFGWDISQQTEGSNRNLYAPVVDNISVALQGTTTAIPAFMLRSRQPAVNGYIEDAHIKNIVVNVNTTGGAVNTGIEIIAGLGHKYGFMQVDSNGNTGWCYNIDGYYTGSAYIGGTTLTCYGEMYGREGKGFRIANSSLNCDRLTLEACVNGVLFISSRATDVSFGTVYLEDNTNVSSAAPYGIVVGGADAETTGSVIRPFIIRLPQITCAAGQKTHALRLVSGLAVDVGNIWSEGPTAAAISVAPTDGFALVGTYRSQSILLETTPAKTTGYDAKFVDLTPWVQYEAVYAVDTLTALESGTVYSNRLASGNVTLTLPAAVVGMHYAFIRMDSEYLRVQPNGSDYIIGGGAAGAAGKYLTCNYGRTELWCHSTGYWTATSAGTLSYEA